MPFNIWCGGCNSMIIKGARFNAEKKQVGNYYSTKIWSFTVKSACCKQVIVIQTDPKNCVYVIISGTQRKIEEYDTEDAEFLALPVDKERSKLAYPFYRLEQQEEDLKKKKGEPVLVPLQIKRKRVAEEEAASHKMGLGIRLLPPSKEAAARIKFAPKFNKNQEEKRALIKASSIFYGSSKSTNKRLELEGKRRKINAALASNILVGGIKPPSWALSAVSSVRQNRI